MVNHQAETQVLPLPGSPERRVENARVRPVSVRAAAHQNRCYVRRVPGASPGACSPRRVQYRPGTFFPYETRTIVLYANADGRYTLQSSRGRRTIIPPPKTAPALVFPRALLAATPRRPSPRKLRSRRRHPRFLLGSWSVFAEPVWVVQTGPLPRTPAVQVMGIQRFVMSIP